MIDWSAQERVPMCCWTGRSCCLRDDEETSPPDLLVLTVRDRPRSTSGRGHVQSALVHRRGGPGQELPTNQREGSRDPERLQGRYREPRPGLGARVFSCLRFAVSHTMADGLHHLCIAAFDRTGGTRAGYEAQRTAAPGHGPAFQRLALPVHSPDLAGRGRGFSG